jgi:hypothetical protein
MLRADQTVMKLRLDPATGADEAGKGLSRRVIWILAEEMSI